jgi:ferritin
MMISETMAAKLNQQVKEEFFSYWTYLAMSYKLHEMGFRGFAKWYEVQAGEEMGHATKIAKYLVEVGAVVKLGTLETPKADYGTVKEIVQTGLDHEKKITRLINECVDVADKENDHATSNFLAWFVDEQVEEVATAQKLLNLVTLATEKIQLLIMEGRIFELREHS